MAKELSDMSKLSSATTRLIGIADGLVKDGLNDDLLDMNLERLKLITHQTEEVLNWGNHEPISKIF